MSEVKYPVLGVGAVVFQNDAVLLVQRKSPPYAGQWCIPGGKVRLGETLASAAEREILEETTVTIRAGEPVYCFEVIKNNKNEIQYHYVVVDLMAEYIAGVPVGKDDAEQAAWVDRKKFSTITVNETTRQLLKEKFNFP